MEVGTMKKTEYMALNPSVDPASVSEFDLARFAFLYQDDCRGFMMKNKGGTFSYFKSTDNWHWTEDDLACYRSEKPSEVLVEFEDWNGEKFLLKGWDTVLTVEGPTVGYQGLNTYETAFQVVI
jgi:hypothetical protein